MKKRDKSYTSFINGNNTKAHAHQEKHEKLYPATNECIGSIVYAGDDEVASAVEAAELAFKTWSQLPINERSRILLAAAGMLRHRVEELAALEVWDTGKPISEALSVDVHSAADSLEYFAKIALAAEDRVIPHQQALIYTRREPLGVCAAIGAWNYPLQIACWKAAPALVMGNTMVYKPSELTPMTTLVLAEVLMKAGLPAGVFNVILGDGSVAEKLIANPSVAKVSFTGSVPTGRKILQQAADRLLPVTLELGGKSPLIIFDDANIEQAVLGSMLANFYTQGEVCSNGTRVFVARKRYDEFIERLVAKVKKLIVGDPFNPATQVGALINRKHMNKVLSYIEQGKASGAQLIYGGEVLHDAPYDQGNFITPAIFTGCQDEMSIVSDEIFGPVMSVLVFDGDDEVIKRANHTSHGLAAGIFTDSIRRAHRVAQQLQAGICWINNYNVTPVAMPFGGYKSSGLGRENGKVALSHYSQIKSIYVELGEIEHTYS